jgi:hypothetical protein
MSVALATIFAASFVIRHSRHILLIAGCRAQEVVSLTIFDGPLIKNVVW